jgi:prepilin-type processing-associated H-X9-DG protein
MLEVACSEVMKIAPDSEDLVGSIKRIGQHPEARQFAALLTDSVANVSYADGHLHESEVEWSMLLGETLCAIRDGRTIA